MVPLLDLLDDRRFTLLVGRCHDGSLGAAGWRAGTPVKAVVEGADFTDPDSSLRRFARLAEGEAILVRPDGHVAAIVPPPGDDLPGIVRSRLEQVLLKEAVA